MDGSSAGYHWVCINFDGRKQYRHFAFVPRAGDFLKLAIPDQECVALMVDSVWFSDGDQEDFVCQPLLNCSRVNDATSERKPAIPL
jgi:hypothetical protein